MATPLPVLVDVDTGGDDALALLLAMASPALEVRGISCVAGNCGLEQVVTNTLRLLDGIDAPPVPVAAGMDRPMVDAGRPPPALHGSDGMGDLGLPGPRRRALGLHAVEFLRDALTEAAEPLTLICLAPLTNIAMLLRTYPQVGEKIARLYAMGGTYAAPGNATPAAEFNVRCDPEAAAIVLGSGLPVTLYPLDPFMQVRITREEAVAMTRAAGAGARIAGGIALHYCNYFGADFLADRRCWNGCGGHRPGGGCDGPRAGAGGVGGRRDERSDSFLTGGCGRQRHSGEGWTEIEVITAVDAPRYRRLDGIGARRGRAVGRLERVPHRD